MRIPGQFVSTIRKLYNALKKGGVSSRQIESRDIVEHLLLGVLRTNGSSTKAVSALKHLREQVVDITELRVTPIGELAEMLEGHVAEPEHLAHDIVRTLHWLVDTFNTLDLEFLHEEHKGAIRDKFEQIPGCPDHARRVALLLTFDIPLFPVDGHMLEYLIANDVLPEGVNCQEAAGFVERHFKAAELAPFYAYLKHAAEQARPKKTKAKSKATAKKKKTTVAKSKAKKSEPKKPSAKSTRKKTAKKVTKKKTKKKK